MTVRIRLARFGRKNLPFYRVFVADSRSPRDGRHLECVGHFDPIPGRDGNKHVGLNFDRIRRALAQGWGALRSREAVCTHGRHLC